MMTNSDKRSDIIQAALELIADRGFHDAPMSEIADKAHVAAGTIYRYFESKDVLIKELFGNLESKMKDFLLSGYPSDKTVREKFSHLLGNIILYLIEHPLHFRFMEQYMNSPYGISKRRDKLMREAANQDSHDDVLASVFEEGISEHLFKDLPLAVLFSLAIGPMISLIRDHTLGFITLDEPLIRQITDACWDAIKR